MVENSQNRQNVALLGRDFWKFSLDFTLTLAVSEVNTPYSSSEPHKSVTVNSQIGVGDSKYVVFDPVPISHVIRGMHSELFWPLTWVEQYFCG